jgi:2-polyprenyl-3-methyl-5-hydroxy-6-metoxy-1,4-benzoquinol methylase
MGTRHEAEREFFDGIYAGDWPFQDKQLDEKIIPTNMMVYWDHVRGIVQRLVEQQEAPHVLDCGCGYGVLSILVARIGARVTAIDISPNSIAIVNRVAASNGLAELIHARAGPLEESIDEAATFDCILGTRVLHHLDISEAGPVLARALKPGGHAVFWECTERNVILRWSRKYLKRILPLPKFGTRHEHPLTHAEIDQLTTDFGRPPQHVDAPFYFFSLADKYVLRSKVGFLSRMLTRLDAIIARRVPVMNRFSFHQILDFEKIDNA